MRAVPHGLEGPHGLGCGGDAFVYIIAITQTEGNIGAEVCKVVAEGDLSIEDRDWSCLFEIIIEKPLLVLCVAL